MRVGRRRFVGRSVQAAGARVSARRPPAPIVNLNSRPGPDLAVGDPAHVARCERMAEEFKNFVGIDVSETWLEVCVLPQSMRRRFRQDAQGWQALCQMVALQAAV